MWVKAHRALFDSSTCLVVAFNVIEHFIGIEIAVVVRNWYRLRMEIQDTWAE